ncbi:BnaC03g46910D [Brassica napus]|uniref:BnaC03g46910D protein n=1 Tax=Brassica napus TaxID=3708 RepID=A0A078GXM0_BRANA|nr:BnaC03g46910D [Brassica napus]
MDYELPKRLFIPHSETEVKHINNQYRLATIDKLELLFPNECKDVKKDLVFAHILRVHHNKLNYSERMIHNMLIKQLMVVAFGSVFKRQKKMFNAPDSYVLEGFSYVLQIWAMEAILAVGKLLGTKLTADFIAGQRCSNWQRAAKDNIYLYISRTGNGDVVDDIQFLRDDVRDFRVDHLNELIMKSYDWIEQVWEAEERVKTSSIHEEQEEEEVDIDNKDVEDDFRTPMAS